MPPQAATPGPRARYREQTRAEIKAAALAQLAEGGTGALALVKIAKELGLSGPALYRYFAGRDDLLDALICDAYADLAGAVADAAATSAGAGGGGSAGGSAGAGAGAGAGAVATPRSRLRDLVRTFRGWAVAQPHRYLLIGGTPVPGYEAPPETREHARAVLGPFVALLAGCTPHPALGPVVADLRAWATREPGVERWLETYLPGASEEAAAAGLAGAVHVWTQAHGTVSLEVSGLYNGMGHDPATLLDAQVELVADALSLA